MKAIIKSKLNTSLITIIAPSIMTASLLVISGCQSTSMNQSINQASSMNTPAAAKTALANALQKQRRSSFSYHSNVEISPAQNLDAVNTDQLSSVNSLESYCEDTHDNAYAALLDQAETENRDILDDDYESQRSTIKQSFLACDTAYRAWDVNRYYAPSEESLEQSVSPYYQQIFDNFDDDTSMLDVKKARLLEAYLLKPLSLNAQGVYQPLAGRFTMLMSAQYFARNNSTSVNQPIYVDLKGGNIYLWADNFAPAISNVADDKLGTKWQNKWLKLALDDGSLPKGFGRSVVEAHFAAMDRTYETAPTSQFSVVTPDSLSTLSLELKKSHIAVMNQTDQIVRREQSAEDYAQIYDDYLVVFYELITTQYPDLVIDEEASFTNTLIDADSFTSKSLVKQALSIIKTMIDRQSDTLINEVYLDAYEGSATKLDGFDSQSSIQTLYGLDKSGKIQWQHQRSQYSSDDHPIKDLNIDAFQQYMPVSSMTSFPNLPTSSQTPSASNSVDLREYSRELVENYRAGNGTALGKMVYQMLSADTESELSEIDVIEGE